MKKTGILNKDISEVIASMGHGDMLVVSDAGLAIPPTVRRIDLAVKPGLPSLLETAEVIDCELKVERVILPADADARCPHIVQRVTQIFNGATVERVSLLEYKELAYKARAIVRTGECTPFANVILVSGVVF